MTPRMPPRLSPERQPVRIRRGYTLVELIIAMTILGILGTLVAQIMMSQQRFFQRMSEQSNVRRELRNTLGTLPTEMRGLSATHGDISSFGATALTFRSTIGTSILCDRPTSTTIDAPPNNAARISLSNWVTMPGVGDTVFALRHDSSGVVGDFWSAHRITGVSTSSAFCPTSPYTDATLDAGKTRYRFTVTPGLADAVTAGAALRFTRSARYELAAQSSGRWFLQRQEIQGGLWTTPVVMSGPYVAPAIGGLSGFALTYFDSTGVAIAPGGDNRRIARIDVVLRALAQAGSGRNSTLPNDSVRLSIAVRNRR
jgi:prepilin-type N-terminal cleavage/methylation domain-containing protein